MDFLEHAEDGSSFGKIYVLLEYHPSPDVHPLNITDDVFQEEWNGTPKSRNS